MFCVDLMFTKILKSRSIYIYIHTDILIKVIIYKGYSKKREKELLGLSIRVIY